MLGGLAVFGERGHARACGGDVEHPEHLVLAQVLGFVAFPDEQGLQVKGVEGELGSGCRVRYCGHGFLLVVPNIVRRVGNFWGWRCISMFSYIIPRNIGKSRDLVWGETKGIGLKVVRRSRTLVFGIGLW